MSINIVVGAGHHDRRFAPVSVQLPQSFSSGRLTRADGEVLACQVEGDELSFLVDRLDADQTGRYVFEPNAESGISGRGVKFKPSASSSTIDVRIGSRLFTTYHYGKDLPRPYFYPVHGPHGVCVTRAFPMEQVEGETQDHIHHRSLLVAYGDVNGCDHWSEGDGFCSQAPRQLTQVVDGPVYGRFTQEIGWLDREGGTLISETRTAGFWSSPDAVKLMDLTLQFHASQGPVRFGSTKEGGICSVRMATTMDGDKGGRIENSVGGVGETECWGRPAHWVDYSGMVDGKHVGVAVFDHPMNLRHPTPWHVRNYGLFSANPFGHSDYKQSQLKDGSYTIDQGDTLTFRYRLLVHKFDAAKAKVGQHYHNWVNPPAVEIE